MWAFSKLIYFIKQTIQLLRLKLHLQPIKFAQLICIEIYANENDFDNCLVLNTNKSVIEALNGNLFLVKGDTIKTPPLEDGCLKGVMRKQILELLAKDVNLVVEEASISPFELQKADEQRRILLLDRQVELEEQRFQL